MQTVSASCSLEELPQTIENLRLAAKTRHPETPTSALDQLGLLVQSRRPAGMLPLPDLSKIRSPARRGLQFRAFSQPRCRCGPRYRTGGIPSSLSKLRWISWWRCPRLDFTIVRNCYHSWLMDRRRKSQLEVDCHGEGNSEELISSISSDEDTPEATLMRKGKPGLFASFLICCLVRCAKYWFCAKSKSSPIVKFRISLPCRSALSCRVWRARERRLRMPGTARQQITADRKLRRRSTYLSQIACRPVRKSGSSAGPRFLGRRDRHDLGLQVPGSHDYGNAASQTALSGRETPLTRVVSRASEQTKYCYRQATRAR